MSRPRPATAPRRRPLPIVALVPRDDGTRDDVHDADEHEPAMELVRRQLDGTRYSPVPDTEERS